MNLSSQPSALRRLCPHKQNLLAAARAPVDATVQTPNAMDLLQLEHFVAVVQEGSFTRAAERVCRTQPAVSQSIKKLEEAVGGPLFARDTPELTLTEAGRALVDYATADAAASGRSHSPDRTAAQSEFRPSDDGGLRVGGGLPAAGTAAQLLQPFSTHQSGHSSQALEEIPRQVMDREIDIGFVKDETLFHGLKSSTW